MEHVRRDVNRLALHLVGPTSVVPYASKNSTNITTSHADGLAVVEGFDSGKEVRVLLNQLCELKQVDTPLLGRGVAPCGLEGLAGGCYGDIDILLCALSN